MEFGGAVSDFTIIAYKGGQRKINLSPIDGEIEFLASGRKHKMVINPIYRIITKSKEGILLRRRRQEENWELECMMMMKAMPLEIFLPAKIIHDIKNNECSEEMLPLLQRGVIIEVPSSFM